MRFSFLPPPLQLLTGGHRHRRRDGQLLQEKKGVGRHGWEGGTKRSVRFVITEGGRYPSVLCFVPGVASPLVADSFPFLVVEETCSAGGHLWRDFSVCDNNNNNNSTYISLQASITSRKRTTQKTLNGEDMTVTWGERTMDVQGPVVIFRAQGVFKMPDLY